MTEKQQNLIIESIVSTDPRLARFDPPASPLAQYSRTLGSLISAFAAIKKDHNIGHLIKKYTEALHEAEGFHPELHQRQEGSATLYDALHSHDSKKKKWKRELGPGRPGRPRKHPIPSDLEDSGDGLSHGQLSGDR